MSRRESTCDEAMHQDGSREASGARLRGRTSLRRPQGGVGGGVGGVGERCGAAELRRSAKATTFPFPTSVPRL